MERISVLHNGTVAFVELSTLWRLEPNDDGRLYYVRWWSPITLRWKIRDAGRYQAHFRSTHHPDDISESYGYFFIFTDGTRGACRVKDINAALSALGYRINIDAEPTGERR